MKKVWQRKSFIIVILLIAILLLLSQFSFAQNNTYTASELKKVSYLENGSTVFAGDTVINSNNLKKYPLASNINYLVGQISQSDYAGAMLSVMTGAVPIPANEILSGNVTNDGKVGNFKGPGYIEIQNDSIYVHSPQQFVWGYNHPYTNAIKTSNGIDIVNNHTGEKIGHIDGNNFNNDSVDKKYLVSGSVLNQWYEHASEGSTYTLEWGISNCNDGRGVISTDILREKLPEAYNYSCKYPNNSPVMLFADNYTMKTVSETSTYLGSHPEYNDANRAYNAKQFVEAWNGTIIPPNASACGKEGVSFSAVPEAGSQSGLAAHGVCPPARTLRNTVMALGISLPVGMDSGEDAVLFNFNPSTGIRITNTLDYPIQIVMWTSGDGTGMAIGSKAIGYVSNN